MSESHSPTDQPTIPTIVNAPIRSERPLRRFEFVRGHLGVSADTALVLIGADGSATTYAHQQPTRGELVARNYVKLYEVDLAHHHQFFEYDLPSNGDAFFFRTEVDVTWHVAHPETVVRRRVHDVRATIEPLLRTVMTSRTRRYAIEHSAEAEAEVNHALAETRIGEEFGLRADCTARLALDADALEHFTAIRKHRYQTQQDAEQHLGARAATDHEHEITQQKLDFYKEKILEDDLWALMLAHNAADLPLVLEGLRSEEREAMATRVQIIQKLLDSGHIENHMIEEAAQLSAGALSDILSKGANGATARRPLYKQQLSQIEPSTDDEG